MPQNHKMNVFFVFFLAALTAEVSGVPISLTPRVRCTQPLWNVVGNHYEKREDCDYFFTDDFQRMVFRQKYFAALFSKSGERANPTEINRILDRWMSLLEPTEYSMTNDVACIGCSSAIDTYRMLSEDQTQDEMLETFVEICIGFNVMNEKICHGVMQTYGRVLMKIVDSTNKTSTEICSLIYNFNCGGEIPPEMKWTLAVPEKKPPVVKPISVSSSVKPLKVLHLTDTHWDLEYAEGTWAECQLPLCCRKDTPLPNPKAARAGKYGGWKCDIPEVTFDDMLDHVSKEHADVDYILWTGDLPPHDIWDQNKASNLDILKRTAVKLRNAFPKTPIFPALGNHESVPPNLFPLSDDSEDPNPMEWLYDELSIQWNKWLPMDVSKTVREGAFYTTLIRPGLRLVSMNMNYCYTWNWWLIVSDVDPNHELKWLIQVLLEAEKKKESVHIIGHIPPGSDDCLKTWQTNYYRIIERFESTVTAQFFGHTHYDKFELYYDSKIPERPIGIGYVAPSLTTYTYHNPSYRIYLVEGDAKESRRFVIDHETWYFDLEEANERNQTDWKRLYSAKSDLNMTSLYPTDWDDFLRRMVDSEDVLEQFHRYYWSDYGKRPKCDDACRKNLICEIRSCAQYGEPK